MTKKLSTDEFVFKARQIHGDKYDYSKINYVNSTSKIKILCPEHGEFLQSPHNHLKGFGCSKCGRLKSLSSRLLSNDEFIAKAQKVHGNRYNYSKIEYHHSKKNVQIICSEHGSFFQTPNSHLSGQGCPKCSKRENHVRLFSNTTDFIEKSKTIHGDKYDYSLVNYTSNKIPVQIVCPTHGEFLQKPYHHLRGQGCFKCSISSHHLKISSIIDVDFIHNDREQLGGSEIDIYVPSLKLGIEINGCYWHGAANQYDNQLRHQDKFRICNDLGIKLLQFWDFEIDENFPIVQSIISHHLKKSVSIGARLCNINPVSANEAFKFLDQNHLQGGVHASIRLGCFYNGELISLLTMRKHHRYEWEISRYVTKIGYHIHGGFSKLMSKFISLYSPKEIMTFADARYSVGSIYQKFGFNYIGLSRPNYFYYKSGERLSRHQCQKHKLSSILGSTFDKNLSETENMWNAGYLKICDAGNHKLIWVKP